MSDLACVAWRFWLLSNEAGEGRKTARRLVVLASFAREFRGFAARAPGSTKPPCYAGYVRLLVMILVVRSWIPRYIPVFIEVNKVIEDEFFKAQ